ncbi:unnamed protein product [Haemonchus placei]|uniref:Uncharacterized protein n=1 Tax=Haemonchus placei TaxID=6290 RepID=A0A3P8D0P8_HAEPC|nr:unnamed protein product [Haemonchus placei]
MILAVIRSRISLHERFCIRCVNSGRKTLSDGDSTIKKGEAWVRSWALSGCTGFQRQGSGIAVTPVLNILPMTRNPCVDISPPDLLMMTALIFDKELTRDFPNSGRTRLPNVNVFMNHAEHLRLVFYTVLAFVDFVDSKKGNSDKTRHSI